MNVSEVLFEQWCSDSCWEFQRIPPEPSRTPDYKLQISGRTVYAEVKEITANDEEKAVLKCIAEGKASGAYGEEPGKTVREKIKDSYAQIKSHASHDKCPGILVLYNNSQMPGLGRIDSYNILTGMFGLQTIKYVISQDLASRLQPVEEYLGPKKSVSDHRNRLLSGIMTLYHHHEHGLSALYFHNPHAAHPVLPEWLPKRNLTQYRVSSSRIGWDIIKDHIDG